MKNIYLCPKCNKELVVLCYKVRFRNFKVEQITYITIHKTRYCPECNTVFDIGKKQESA